jgi:hypothetical protein
MTWSPPRLECMSPASPEPRVPSLAAPPEPRLFIFGILCFASFEEKPEWACAHFLYFRGVYGTE